MFTPLSRVLLKRIMVKKLNLKNKASHRVKNSRIECSNTVVSVPATGEKLPPNWSSPQDKKTL